MRTAVALAGLTILVRAVPAWFFYGTSDVEAWQILAQTLLEGGNFYATQLHNWPPLWIYLAAAAWLGHLSTGLSFWFLVKLPPIAADACLTLLLCRFGPRTGLAYALNPVSILVTGYHGQFDAVMLAPAFLAWSVFPRHRVGSGLALGLGVWVKAVPLLLLPLFLARLTTWRARAAYTGLAIGPAFLGTLPYFVVWPTDVADNFLRYSSWYGQWGYPLVYMLLQFVRAGVIPDPLSDPDSVSLTLRLIFLGGRWVLLAGLVACWWLAARQRRPLLNAILLTFSVFYVLTVGFGVQYLVWIVPFALAARDRRVWPYTAAASLALLAAYVMGLQDAYLPPRADWPPLASPMREFVARLASLPAWLVCVAWSAALLRSPAGSLMDSARPSALTTSQPVRLGDA